MIFEIWDENTKSIIINYGSLDLFQNDYNLDTNNIKVYPEQQQTTGRKLVTNELLEIVVPGNIDYTQMYRVIDTHLTGNINSKDTLNKGDVKLSGKYQIIEIKDKIVNNTFNQKLKIRRVGEQIDKMKAQ